MSRSPKIIMDLAKASRTVRPKAANSPRCRECVAYDAKRQWCPILASVRLPAAGMCDYGKRKRASEAVMRSPSCRKRRGK